MRKLLKIKVLKKDIKEGKPHDPHKCAIALAARRVLKNVDFVSNRIYFKFNKKVDFFGKNCAMPGKCMVFIGRFDSGKSVKPFTFTVSAPVEFIK